VVSKSTYFNRPLFDPNKGVHYIKDIVQMDDKYLHRVSDLVVGMLYLGAKVGAIRKTQACYFKVALLPHMKLRTSVYQHEGNPFVGSDGGAMTIDGVVFGGAELLSAGRYNLDNVEQDPSYHQWVSMVLFRGKGINDYNYNIRGEHPPKRAIDGTALSEWGAWGENSPGAA
jgi:hypothetical protein